MKSHRVEQHLNRVERAFALAKHMPHDEEIMSHYSRYLCVLCSGYLEMSIRTILSTYATKSAKTTSNYVTTQLAFVRNPKMDTIIKLVSAFDATWRDTFLEKVEGAPSDSVNSIVDNRNKIAHGENVSISLSVIEGYFFNAKVVIKLIDEKFHVP